MKRATPRGKDPVSLVEAFGRARVLVLGDVMVDRYYSGAVRRISPEAPVPVVEVAEEHQRLGGAANVANNLRSLGARVELCGVVGGDAEGAWLAAELRNAGIGVAGLVTSDERPTTLKCRVVAHRQQVVRFDREGRGAHPQDVQRRIAAFCAGIWPDVDVAVVSDYGKGLVQETLMNRLRALNRGPNRRPIAVDPKSAHFELYRGTAVVTPNLGEALVAARVKIRSGADLLERAGAALLKRCGGAAILITRGEEGMTLFEAGKPAVHLPTVARQVYDVTGAGDTVIAVVALGLGCGATLPQAAALANRAAGVVVGEFGTAPVTREKLLGTLAASKTGASVGR